MRRLHGVDWRSGAVAAWLVISAVAGRAEDWPQFRGPTGQGISTEKGLPVEWSATRNVAWKTPIPGKGWSSPIVQGGRVYLTTAAPLGDASDGDQAAQSLRALALDARGGKVLWDVEVFAQDPARPRRKHTKNSHASPTPVTDGRRIWVHYGTHGTACLDLDGKVVWRTLELDYDPVHGSGSSPVLAGDLLIVACDGAADPFVAGLDRASGEVRWKTPRPKSEGKQFAFSTAIVIEEDRRRQVFVPGANWAASYDPASGRELWRVWHGGYSIVCRPVYGHGLVFFSSCYDDPSLLAVRAGGAGDVTKTHVAWSERASAPHNPSSLLVGDELYFASDNGVASCVDARTGKRHWRERLGGNYSASPVYAEGRIYFQSEDGEGVVIRAGKEFEVLSRNDIGERTLASYAVSTGALFIRGAKHLYCIERGERGG